jgi:hypothetical protein
MLENMPDRSYESIDEVKTQSAKLTRRTKEIWDGLAETPQTTVHSKGWWNADCTRQAAVVRELRKLIRTARRQHGPHNPHTVGLETNLGIQLRKLKKECQRAKRHHYDRQIEKLHHQRIWDVVNWTKPRQLNPGSIIKKADGTVATSSDELADTFQTQFCPAKTRQTDDRYCEHIQQHDERDWAPILIDELLTTLKKTSNVTAPGPDHLTWYWLKHVIIQGPYRYSEDDHGTAHAASKLRHLYNGCVQYEYCPDFMKESTTMVHPKPQKKDYDTAKSYRPIILLNTFGKLMEKIISDRMQYEGQKYGILHPCQYGGTMQHSTQDAGIQVVHNIREAWAKGRLTSALLVDIAQFFPSLNHGLAVKVFRRQGYNSTLCGFLEHYFKDRNTRFLFNGSLTESQTAYSGAGQGSCFSPVATALYLALALHHAAPVRTKPTDRTHQFFVDNGFIQAFSDKMTHIKGARDRRIAQLRQNARTLADAYGRLVTSMRMAGLELEPNKSDLIHFVRGKKPYTDTEPLGPKVYLDNHDGKPLVPIEPTDTVRYLGFYLKPNLSWRDHLRYYSVKAQSTVNALRMLGNSARGFSPYHKRRLYISNVLPILTYGAQLWWNPSWN